MHNELITRRGSVNLSDSSYSVDVSGALHIQRPDGGIDLVSPAHWVAVVTDGSSLDWGLLVGNDE